MTLTRLSLDNPVAVVVGGLLVMLFGAIALQRLPIQLTPEVVSPEITIRTNWRTAAPEEIESEILEPQEKVLRGLPGMTEMLSQAQRGRGSISISFGVDYDLQRGLVEVLNEGDLRCVDVQFRAVTRIEVQVPPYVVVGELVRIDTRDGHFVERVKK